MADDGPGGHPPPPQKCSQCNNYVPCPVHDVPTEGPTLPVGG